MRGTLTFGGLILVVLAIGLVAKKQLSTPIKTTAQPASNGRTQQVLTKPAEIPKQVQHELNSAANEAAKRLERLEGKQ
jgi:hypothetical protein